MQTIDTNVVVMNAKQAGKPCTAYMFALDFHVHKNEVHTTGSLILALNSWVFAPDTQTEETSTD